MTAVNSDPISVAVIGTGPNPSDSNAPSMAYHHGNVYTDLDDCTLIGCADLVQENASAFADAYEIDSANVYSDHTDLLAEVEPDLVSVCVPPAFHADIVISCAENNVGAVHCEKPMALTWDGTQRMVDACAEYDVQLTFNHQRRFGTPWRRAKGLLGDGMIGELERIEMVAPNLFDWGIHCFDLCGMYAGEPSPEWVLGQIDYSEENVIYGAHQENQAVATWEYDNGVKGLALTGAASNVRGAYHRLEGECGQIEIRSPEKPTLRYWNDETGGWQQVECERSSFPEMVRCAITHVVDSFLVGERPELCAENALKSTELIFGTWESARSRGVVKFPLQITGNPLEELVENGDLNPQ